MMPTKPTLNLHTKQLLMQHLVQVRTPNERYLKCVPKILVSSLRGNFVGVLRKLCVSWEFFTLFLNFDNFLEFLKNVCIYLLIMTFFQLLNRSFLSLSRYFFNLHYLFMTVKNDCIFFCFKSSDHSRSDKFSMSVEEVRCLLRCLEPHFVIELDYPPENSEYYDLISKFKDKRL